MIKLQKREKTSFKKLEEDISHCVEEKDIYSFYENFIKDYIKLEKKYSFTEAFDEEHVFQQLNAIALYKSAPLYSIPFGIKDIFNTQVLATSMGSDIWRGFKAGNNARIVDDIVHSGGVVFSKTTTAEFAVHFITPERTLNPYNQKHITGTSSSGSAVAVSCGALPISIGTQTAGSIIRPASFCGIYGFKPSFGAIDRTGVLKTNDTFDTIGFLSADIYGIKKTFYNTMQKGKDYPYSLNYFLNFEKYYQKKDSDIKIGIICDNLRVFKGFENYVKDDFEFLISNISNKFNISEIPYSNFLDEIHVLHETMYSKSLSYYFKNEVRNYLSISIMMNEMIKRGDAISTDSYIECVKKQPIYRKKMDAIFENYDFIIVPSTASYAPELSKNEINDTCLIWTFLGYPTITIPLFMCLEKNLPYGLQIVAKKFDDFSLLNFSERFENIFK
jgi:Asp-tRNA(Asn)/Glu-tRNA(Gln) amidotransferase A subunit family amidase